MDHLEKNTLLLQNDDSLVAVRKLHNLGDQGKMEGLIEILEKWIEQQQHFLKKDFPKHRLEMTLISCKGSIEKTKVRLDKMCTIRTLLPQYFQDYDIVKDFTHINTMTFRAPLPRLTKDHIRVSIIKAIGNKLHTNYAMECICLAVMYMEYFFLYDYNDGIIFIIDLTEISLKELIAKLYPSELRNGVTVMMDAVGIRIKQIHIISPSIILDTLIKIIKQVVGEKIRNRIYAHKNIETVYEFVERDLLPVEYGGDEISYEILNDDGHALDFITPDERWLQALNSEDFRRYQQEMLNACTDESKRLKDLFNQKYMGLPGTFRMLNVD